MSEWLIAVDHFRTAALRRDGPSPTDAPSNDRIAVFCFFAFVYFLFEIVDDAAQRVLLLIDQGIDDLRGDLRLKTIGIMLLVRLSICTLSSIMFFINASTSCCG